MCDDREDTTFLGNWRFYVVLACCMALWAVVLWAAIG